MSFVKKNLNNEHRLTKDKARDPIRYYTLTDISSQHHSVQMYSSIRNEKKNVVHWIFNKIINNIIRPWQKAPLKTISSTKYLCFKTSSKEAQ